MIHLASQEVGKIAACGVHGNVEGYFESAFRIKANDLRCRCCVNCVCKLAKRDREFRAKAHAGHRLAVSRMSADARTFAAWRAGLGVTGDAAAAIAREEGLGNV